ncbi:MAG: hypothetical protein JW715_07425 [Sedimentisphaerales bacterium]|nr:hypothetical protein [Sedimentisphaerales bacterium]
MLRVKWFFVLFYFFISVFSGIPLYSAEETSIAGRNESDTPGGLKNLWDPAKYIGLDEIKPGMEAYCLTEYGTAGIEKFSMQVVDIVRNMNTGSELIGDIILVKGLDDDFIRTGPVAGCSGSPLYIDNRLAGALAFTWTYSTEPLYAATPIAKMLSIGQAENSARAEQSDTQTGLMFDFSCPTDFTKVYRLFTNSLTKPERNLASVTPLPCPLITSGIPTEVCEQFSSKAFPFGVMVAAGGSGGNTESSENIRLEPGATLAVPLVSGDIQISTFGTVTEVVDDKVYGFGHLLLGQGQIDLPMATGKVHTVVSNTVRSFKVASLAETVGALRSDEASGVVGLIGATAHTIPLTINTERYNDTQKRTYNCRLVYHKQLTPSYLEMAIAGAALYKGSLPLDHTIDYNISIGMENGEFINAKNISTGLGLNELMSECIGATLLIMDNPFKKIDVESIAIDIHIAPKDLSSTIWSVDLSDTTVKAGEDIEIVTIIESILSGKKKYSCRLEIPDNLEPGKYELIVCGSQGYEQFLAKMVPHKFLAKSMPDLIEALNNALNIPRDRLYCLLILPASGVTLEKSELPDLPATKAMILQDTKRTTRIQPYQHWTEKSKPTGTIISGRKSIRITVEK